MFCPKCATQNVDGASFCRSCGANISLIPQALTGQLPAAQPKDDFEQWSRRRRHREPSLDDGVRHLLMGVAFVIISLLISRYSPGGWTWWYWMLIPAAIFLARGVSEIVRTRQAKPVDPGVGQPQMTSGTRVQSLPPQETNELMAPVPSVTEGTTRHLGAEASKKHFDSWENQKPS
jgi:zinc ribbon protein